METTHRRDWKIQKHIMDEIMNQVVNTLRNQQINLMSTEIYNRCKIDKKKQRKLISFISLYFRLTIIIFFDKQAILSKFKLTYLYLHLTDTLPVEPQSFSCDGNSNNNKIKRKENNVLLKPQSTQSHYNSFNHGFNIHKISFSLSLL